MTPLAIRAKSSIPSLALCVLLAGCAHAAPPLVPGDPASPPAGKAEPAAVDPVPSPAIGDAKQFSWMRPPAPISGRWKTTAGGRCGYEGMVVELQISADQPRSATGRVVAAGRAARLGYHKGEVVAKLEANDFGAWSGKVKWRSILGDKRWDPIYFVLEGAVLKARMSVDGCWSLTRQ